MQQKDQVEVHGNQSNKRVTAAEGGVGVWDKGGGVGWGGVGVWVRGGETKKTTKEIEQGTKLSVK